LIEYIKYENDNNKGFISKKTIENNVKFLSYLMVDSKKILIRRKMKKMQKTIRYLQINREAEKIKMQENKHLRMIILDRRKAKIDIFKEGIDFLTSNQSDLEDKIQEIKDKYGKNMAKSTIIDIGVIENQIEFNKKNKLHLQEAEKEVLKVFESEHKVLEDNIEKANKNMRAGKEHNASEKCAKNHANHKENAIIKPRLQSQNSRQWRLRSASTACPGILDQHRRHPSSQAACG